MSIAPINPITHYTSCAFIINNNKILFLKQERSDYWLLPGGHIEENELPADAVIREVFEETGLKIELLQKPNEEGKSKTVTPLPVPYDVRLIECKRANIRDVDFVFTTIITENELKINNESKQAKWLGKEDILSDPHIGPYTKHHAIKILNETKN